MLVIRHEGNAHHQGAAQHRPHDRNKFQRARRGADHKRVRHAHGPRDQRDGQHGQQCDEQLRADEVAEHGIHFVQSGGGHAPILLPRHRFDERGAKLAAIFQEEHRKDGHQNQPPKVFRRVHHLSDCALGGDDDLLAMTGEETFHLMLGLCAPATAAANLIGDLPGADFFRQAGKRCHQTLRFLGDARGGQRQHQGDDAQRHQIYGGDRQPARVAQPALHPRHRRLQQVSKKDGEDEGDDGAPGGVHEHQPQAKQDGGEQHPRRALVE